MSAELVVVKGKDRGASLPVEIGSTKLIGRASDAGLRLRDDKKVSSEHARVEGRAEGQYFIEDLGSTNGTYVNGTRIKSTPLRSGDRVKIGNSLLVFRADSGSVHLSDLELRGGGSSHDVIPQGAALTAAAPSPSELPQGRVPEAGRGAPLFGAALEQVALLLGSSSDARVAVDRALEIVLKATGAARAILFLRDPIVGGLGCAAAVGRDDVREGVPVDPDVLKRAVGGEVAASTREIGATAVPVRQGDRVAGALYLDNPSGRDAVNGEGRFLAAVAGVVALALRADRAARLVGAGAEILAMAQEPARRNEVVLDEVIASAVRIYAPAAQARGLSLVVEGQAGARVVADPVLLARALDRVVEAALVSAKGGVRLGVEQDEHRCRLVVARGGPALPEALAREVLDPDGPAGDLRRSLARGGEGILAVAAAAARRAGGGLDVRPADDRCSASFVIEVPRAPPGPA